MALILLNKEIKKAIRQITKQHPHVHCAITARQALLAKDDATEMES
jgi:hypothetical protein